MIVSEDVSALAYFYKYSMAVLKLSCVSSSI